MSLSNVVATTCQYEALKHVTFAVQTLGKCAKMFPVMIWGYFILKKRYSLRDVTLAVCITGGCFIFFMTGSTTSRVAKDRHSSLYGLLLMGGYLTADGYTSTFQQKMFKGYAMTSYNQVRAAGCMCSSHRARACAHAGLQDCRVAARAHTCACKGVHVRLRALHRVAAWCLCAAGRVHAAPQPFAAILHLLAAAAAGAVRVALLHRAQLVR